MSWRKILGIENTSQNPQNSNIEGFEAENVRIGFNKISNQQYISPVTTQLTPCNLVLDKLDPELKAMLGEELDYYIANPEALKLITELFRERQQMRMGVIPGSYCYQAHCDCCGTIPYHIRGAHVAGCPWCLLGGFKKQENNNYVINN